MSTSTESYTAVAGQAREATEKSVETFKQGVEKFTEQANVFAKLPTVDLTQPVARYFEQVQKAVDLNRELATKWADAVSSMSGTLSEQVAAVSKLAQDQTKSVAGVVSAQADAVQETAANQADAADQEAKAETRRAKAAERSEAKEAQAKAREPYLGLTKAELSDKLAERGLPKSGNLSALIDRLVESDAPN